MLNSAKLWQSTLRRALSLPGIHVDRSAFLQKELKKVGVDELTAARFSAGALLAAIPENKLDAAAQRCIRYHSAQVSAISAASGIPGGLTGALTVPADMLQYLWHVLVLAQKLAYLYGYPSLTDEHGRLSPRGQTLLTILCVTMLGAGSARQALTVLASRMRGEPLPYSALKSPLLSLVKDTAAFLGVKLSKQLAARGFTRLLPVISAVTAGALTLRAFYPKAKELQRVLKQRHLPASPLK